MSPKSKREYLETVAIRYRSASFKQKTIILNEFCCVYKCHRKHAIRILRAYKRFIKPKIRKRGRKPHYDSKEFIIALRNIWVSANLPCSKRLKAIIPIWLPHYHKEYGYLSLESIKLFNSISSATIDRVLKPVRIKYTKRGRCTTKPGSLLRKHIPIKTNQWDESKPGFLEADTVAHCGTAIAGNYIYTIDTVDIATGWTEQRATWGKGESGVLEQIKDIEHSIPFPLLGFDSDNGSEFLNYHLLRYCHNRKQPVQFTRSRAYHKNDNAHVEQKNWTHVRQWFGYERLDNPMLVPLLNDLYKNEWRLYHNFFCPSVKLIKKERIGSATIKQFDTPKTPYQRIIDSPYISYDTKQLLKKLFLSLNPFFLRKAMEQKLANIFKNL